MELFILGILELVFPIAVIAAIVVAVRRKKAKKAAAEAAERGDQEQVDYLEQHIFSVQPDAEGWLIGAAAMTDSGAKYLEKANKKYEGGAKELARDTFEIWVLTHPYTEEDCKDQASFTRYLISNDYPSAFVNLIEMSDKF